MILNQLPFSLENNKRTASNGGTNGCPRCARTAPRFLPGGATRNNRLGPPRRRARRGYECPWGHPAGPTSYLVWPRPGDGCARQPPHPWSPDERSRQCCRLGCRILLYLQCARNASPSNSVGRPKTSLSTVAVPERGAGERSRRVPMPQPTGSTGGTKILLVRGLFFPDPLTLTLTLT